MKEELKDYIESLGFKPDDVFDDLPLTIFVITKYAHDNNIRARRVLVILRRLLKKYGEVENYKRLLK